MNFFFYLIEQHSQVFVTYRIGALHVQHLWFYKHQHDNRVRSKLFVVKTPTIVSNNPVLKTNYFNSMDHFPTEHYSLSASYLLFPSLSISIFPSDFRTFFCNVWSPPCVLRKAPAFEGLFIFLSVPVLLSTAQNFKLLVQQPGWWTTPRRLSKTAVYTWLPFPPSSTFLYSTITALILQLKFAETASSR
jgi:hypothetical protein